MKKYNINNYVRYKLEVEQASKKLRDKSWEECSRDELIAKLLDCSARTIHRNMGEELKREKELLNQQL